MFFQWTVPGTHWGFPTYGFMLAVGFLSAAYLGMRRGLRVKCDPDIVLNCAMLALIFGVIGARVFYVVHYWDESFAHLPNKFFALIDLTRGGLEFLGGFIGGAIGVVGYLAICKHSIRVYGEIVVIMLLWGHGFGRLGCFLNGCCFGSVCVDEHRQPAGALAVQFPFGSPASYRQWENRQLKVPAELIVDAFRDDLDGPLPGGAGLIDRKLLAMSPEQRYKPLRHAERLEEQYELARHEHPDATETKQLARAVENAEEAAKLHRAETYQLELAEEYPSRADPSRDTTMSELTALARQHPAVWVHPTQLYSAASAFLLCILLDRVFYRRKRHGLVIGLMLILYPLSRVPMEIIRADNPVDTLGLTVSQAISLAMFLAGIVYLFVLYRYLPERSPAAVPFVPPNEDPQSG